MHDDMKNTTPDSHKKKRIVIGVSALLVAILAAGGAVAIYQHSASAQLVKARRRARRLPRRCGWRATSTTRCTTVTRPRR